MYPDSATQQDLRREPRLPAAGTVIFKIGVRTITGQLLDVSRSGFRAAHACPDLATGINVRFRHPGGSGRARVVWNRITGSTVETGFFVLD